MDRPRRRLGGELLTVALVVACLAGTLASVVAIHRRPPLPPDPPAMVATATPAPEVAPASRPIPKPAPAPITVPPPQADPTAPIVAELAAAEAREKAEADRATRRATAIEAAALAAKAGAERESRNLLLARRQINTLASLAVDREVDAEMVGLERDSLARRRDALKADLKDDAARPAGYAVLPHKGPNGTWRRPIVLECVEGGVIIRPQGATFGLAEITSPFGRSNAFVAAVARKSVRVQRKTSPDGGEVVPYIFFIVRPEGIRPYYEARGRLERLGVAFGYELADAEWQIDVPDLDNPATWDGSRPPTPSTATADDALASLPDAARRPVVGGSDNPFIWPKTPPGMEEGDGAGPNRFRSDDGPRFLGGLSGDAPGRGPAPLGGGDGDESAPGRPGSSTRGRGVGSGPSWEAWDRANRLDGPDRPVGLGSTPTGSEPGGTSDSQVRPGFGESDKPLVRLSNKGRGTGVGSADRGSQANPDPSNSRSGVAPGSAQPGSTRGGPGGLTGGASALQEGVIGNPGNSRPPGATLPPLQRGGTGESPPGSGREIATTTPSTSQGGQFGPGRSPSGSSGGSTGNGPVGSSGGGGSAGGGSSASGGTSGGSSSASGGASGTSGGASGSPSLGQPGGSGGAGMPSFGRATRQLELVLACGPKGVAIHPGDYRVTTDALKGADPLLVPQLTALVRHKENTLKGAAVLPSIRYVIEPGGQANYATARGQIAVSGLDWPTTIQVSGSEILRLYSTDAW